MEGCDAAAIRVGTSVVDQTAGIFQYAFAPFFCYPPKLLVHWLLGTPYPTSYAHFRRDHQDDLNLFLHGLCLPLQLLSNFAFLVELDRFLGLDIYGVVTTSFTNALLWSLYLCATPSPVAVRALSTLA